MPENEYNHFLLLFVAVRIISCNIHNKYFPIASKLFEMYVKEYASIYGGHNVGSNVHNLIHIIEDMENCNVRNIMEISTYKYENALRTLGLKLKHTNRPLEQIVCRTIEQNILESNPHEKYHSNEFPSTQFKPKVSCCYNFQNIRRFKKIEFAPNIILSSRNSNKSWFMTKSKEIVKFEYVEVNNSLDFKLFGKKINGKNSFFENPVNSMKLDIYECDVEFESDLKTFDLECIATKMICLSYKKKIVLIPLLHTLEILNK